MGLFDLLSYAITKIIIMPSTFIEVPCLQNILFLNPNQSAFTLKAQPRVANFASIILTPAPNIPFLVDVFLNE